MKQWTLLILTMGLVACSGSGPSSSWIEEKALATYKGFVPANMTVKVSKSKCEPTSREKQYQCYVLFNVDGKDKDARVYNVTQANGEWFITGGGYGFPRAKHEELGFKIEE